jgi:hypothetical protein
MVLAEGKICSKCKEFKQYTNFTKDRSIKDGYKSRCRICKNAENSEYKKTTKGKLAKKRQDIRRLYGLTLEQWGKMFTDQGGACKICGRIDRKLCVDHSHKTGEIRGLLCKGCNLKLGWFETKQDKIYQYLGTRV